MREIKFRAWDKKDKRIWWNIQDAYDTLGCHENHIKKESCDCDKMSEFDEISFGAMLDNDRYDVMQFTGLKDKDGQDIYEGDILEFGQLRSAVIFDEGSFYLIDYLKFFLLHNFFPGDNTNQKVRFSQYIIIGNIYENPELLKQK